MLSREENDLLTRTDPGSPGGDLMRCYWQPAALSEELQEGIPLHARLLGEDLVLFRDDQGQIGLLGLHCSHRGADLSLGRVEDGGLRCLYHGWLYDRQGRCLEQPAEPPGSDFKTKIRHPAYPCREAAGMIFAYMGQGEPPLLPAYEPLTAPVEHRHVTKHFVDCNWLQGNEGEIDPAHTSFLHRRLRRVAHRAAKGTEGVLPMTFQAGDVSPRIEVEETDFGLRIFSMRTAGEGAIYLRITNFIVPNVSAIVGPMAGDGYDINWHVPIDDTHHWKYTLTFCRSKPLDAEDWEKVVKPKHDEIGAGYRLVRNRANRYLQDRESMKTWNFCGMGTTNNPQDAAMIEGAGPIQDRAQEHLGTTDKAIIAARRILLKALGELQAGREPPHVVREASANRFPHLAVTGEVIPTSEDWRTHWRKAAGL